MNSLAKFYVSLHPTQWYLIGPFWGPLMIKTLLWTGAAVVLTGSAALAADIAAPPESNAGFFGYVEGGYIFKTDSNVREFESASDDNVDDARAGDGWDGSLKLGYRFDNDLDIAIGGRYFDQSSGKRNNDQYDWQNTDGQYWSGDIELGYSYFVDDAVIRPFIGVKYQDWKSKFNDNEGTPIYKATNKSWGIGPEVGFDGSVGIADALRLFGGADASLLFGNIKGHTGVDQYFDDKSEGRTFWTVGAHLGLAWAITPALELGAGYKVEWLDGINYATFADDDNAEPDGRGGELIHGPFGRLSFNFP
jgi:outer membrane protein W